MRINPAESKVLKTHLPALGSVAAIAFGALIASSPHILAQETNSSATPMQTQDDAQQTVPVQDVTQPRASTGDLYVVEQQDGEIAVSSYIGSPVVNASDETVGDINDLILNENGQVSTAIIGVGGFLGIGQKNVAVRFDSIAVRLSPDSDVATLVIDATKEQLSEAPSYITVAMKRAEEEAARYAQEMQAQQNMPTGSIGSGTLPSEPPTKPAN